MSIGWSSLKPKRVRDEIFEKDTKKKSVFNWNCVRKPIKLAFFLFRLMTRKQLIKGGTIYRTFYYTSKKLKLSWDIIHNPVIVEIWHLIKYRFLIRKFLGIYRTCDLIWIQSSLNLLPVSFGLVTKNLPKLLTTKVLKNTELDFWTHLQREKENIC